MPGYDADVPAYTELVTIGGREKPYGSLLVAMRDGRRPFALAHGDGPLPGRCYSRSATCRISPGSVR